MASTFQLCSMILPQLENKSHGVEVVGMMFFDDNLNVLAKGNEFGERLSKVAKEQNILLMICDQCAIRRGFGEGDFEQCGTCLLYTSPSPRDRTRSRMPSSA